MENDPFAGLDLNAQIGVVVETARADFFRRFGFAPTLVYLGAEDYQRVAAEAPWGAFYMDWMTGRAKLHGLSVVRVNERRYFTVG